MDKSSREYPLEYNRELRRRIKAEVIAHYGGRCACCGTTENLTIDHPEGNGAEHRRAIFGNQGGGYRFYLWLRRSGFPSGYQVLCLPCNQSKGRTDRCHIEHGHPELRRCRDPYHSGENPLPTQAFYRDPTTGGNRSRCKGCFSRYAKERNQ